MTKPPEKVKVSGVLLDPDDPTRGHVAAVFGEDRLIACRSEDLPHITS